MVHVQKFCRLIFCGFSRSVQPDPKPIPGPAGPQGPSGPRGPAGEDGRDGRDVSVTSMAVN